MSEVCSFRRCRKCAEYDIGNFEVEYTDEDDGFDAKITGDISLCKKHAKKFLRDFDIDLEV